MTRPSASGVPRRSSSGSSPDTPIATSTMPQRHGRPNESETMTGTSTPNRSRTAGPDRARGRVRVARQQGHDRARAGPDVRGVDAAVGADEPVRGLGDHDAVVHAHDAPGLAQHDLDLARIAVPALGELDRLGPRLDRRSGRRSRPRPSRRPSGSRPARRRSRQRQDPGVRSMASPIRSRPGRRRRGSRGSRRARGRATVGLVSRHACRSGRRSTRRGPGRPGVSMSKASGPSSST